MQSQGTEQIICMCMATCGYVCVHSCTDIKVFSAKSRFFFFFKKKGWGEKVKRKKLQLLVPQQDLHIAKEEEKQSAVQGEVSEKLVTEASVAIEKKLNCHKVLHMERRQKAFILSFSFGLFLKKGSLFSAPTFMSQHEEKRKQGNERKKGRRTDGS